MQEQVQADSGSRYTISDMLPEHGREVGYLHATVIEHSFISGLGAEFLEKLYEILLTKRYCQGTVILDQGTVVGLSFGRDTMGPTMSQVLLRSAPQLFWPVLKLVFTRPRALMHSAIGVLQSKAAARAEGVAEWMSVAVTPGARARERSYQLVEAYFAKLNREGYHTARGAAHEGNIAAQKFFHYLGGHIYDTTSIAGKKSYWFEWDLTRPPTRRPAE